MKFFLLCAFVILATASARVTRDAPKEISFSDFFENAGKSLKDLETNVLKIFGAENTEELQAKAVEDGKKIASQLDDWAKTVKKETEDLKDTPAVKELRTSVDKALEDFKAKHPDTVADVQSFIEKANKGTEDVIAKLKGLGESDEAKNLKDISEKLLESASKTFEKITKDVQESLKKD